MRRRKQSPWQYEVAILDEEDEQSGEWETCKIVERLDDGTVSIVCKDDEDEEIITVEAIHVREKKKKKKNKKKKKSQSKKEESQESDSKKESSKPNVKNDTSVEVKNDQPNKKEVIKPVIKEKETQANSDELKNQEEDVEPAEAPQEVTGPNIAQVEDKIDTEQVDKAESVENAGADDIAEEPKENVNEQASNSVAVADREEEIKEEREVKQEEKAVPVEIVEKVEIEEAGENMGKVENAEADDTTDDLTHDRNEHLNGSADNIEDEDVAQTDEVKQKEAGDEEVIQQENEDVTLAEVVGKVDTAEIAVIADLNLEHSKDKEPAQMVEDNPEIGDSLKPDLDAIKDAVKQELDVLEAGNNVTKEEDVTSREEEEVSAEELDIDAPIVPDVMEVSESQELEAVVTERVEFSEPARVENAKDDEPEESKKAEVEQSDPVAIEPAQAEVSRVDESAELEKADVFKQAEEDKGADLSKPIVAEKRESSGSQVNEPAVLEEEECIEQAVVEEPKLAPVEDLESNQAVALEEPEILVVQPADKIKPSVAKEASPVDTKNAEVNELTSVEEPNIGESAVVVQEVAEIIEEDKAEESGAAVIVKEEAVQEPDGSELAAVQDVVNEEALGEAQVGAREEEVQELEVVEKKDVSNDTEPQDGGGNVTDKQSENAQADEEIKEYVYLTQEQMTATRRENIRWVCEVEVLSNGASLGDWLPCNIEKENKDGSFDIQCNAGLVHYIPAAHVRTVPIQWTHEVLEIVDGEVEWLRCIILDGEAEENNVNIHVENQILNKEVRKNKIKPIEMYWTHDMAEIKDMEPTGEWLQCIILAQEEDGNYTVQREDGTIWDDVSGAMIRPARKDWTHEYQVLMQGIKTDQWRRCIILNEDESGEAASVHTEEGFIEVVETALLRSLFPEEIVYTHKVATFTENGDTAEWWPCFIVDVFDDGTVRVECENGTYDVNAEDVLSMQEGPAQLAAESQSQISKLHQSPSNKAWYSTVSLVTIRGYDGKTYNFPEGTRVLITDFEGDTVKIEEPVFGWTHLFDDDQTFLFKFEEDWVKSVLSGKSWYDILGEVKTRILDYSASFENSRIVEPTKYEVIGSNGCTIREEYALTSPKIEKLAKGSIIEIVEMKGRRARILRPKRGWISMHSTEGTWFIQKVDENEPSDPEQDSDEEADIEVEPSVVGLDQFEDSDDPEFIQLKKDWLVLKQANILQNRQLVSKDKKFLRLQKQLKSRTRKTYGVHSNFWEELGSKQRRRTVIQREIRSKSALNEKLKIQVEKKKTLFEEKQDILQLLIDQRNALLTRIADDKLKQETALAEHQWRNKYGALEDGLQHLSEQKEQLEDFHHEMVQEIEAKKGALKALQDARVEFSKKAEVSKKDMENNKARIDMAVSWRRQLRRKLRGLRKIREAQKASKVESTPVSPTASDTSLGDLPQSPEPMPSEI